MVSSKENEIVNLNKRIDNLEAEVSRTRLELEAANRRVTEKTMDLKRTQEDYDALKARNETMQKVI